MHTKNTTKQFMHTYYSCSGWVSIFIPWSATQWKIQMFLIFEKIIRSRICQCIHLVLKKDKLGIQIRPGWGVKLKSLFAIMWKWNWNKFWIILVIFFCSIPHLPGAFFLVHGYLIPCGVFLHDFTHHPNAAVKFAR